MKRFIYSVILMLCIGVTSCGLIDDEVTLDNPQDSTVRLNGGGGHSGGGGGGDNPPPPPPPPGG